jgi:hypothetical protein
VRLSAAACASLSVTEVPKTKTNVDRFPRPFPNMSNEITIDTNGPQGVLHLLQDSLDIGAAKRLKEADCCLFSFCLKLEGFLYAPSHDGVDSLGGRALLFHQVFKVLESLEHLRRDFTPEKDVESD